MSGFSDDIGMGFGLSKGAKATFKRGKLETCDHIQLDEETMIKDLEQKKVYRDWLNEETMIKDMEQKKVYKYLRVDESS